MMMKMFIFRILNEKKVGQTKACTPDHNQQRPKMDRARCLHLKNNSKKKRSLEIVRKLFPFRFSRHQKIFF